MRVVFLVAGAGGMYCGSCLRDNRLAATLINKGRDVILIPLYTPIRTDEQDVSEETVYFGGLSVFLQHRWQLFRHVPRFAARILDAPVVLRAIGRFASATSPASLGPLTISVLEGAHGGQQRAVERLIAGLEALRPSLISLPNLMFVGIAAALRKTLRIPVVCSLSGEDLFLDALPQQFRERAHNLIAASLKDVSGFIAPTLYYAEYATERFGLPRGMVHHVPLGVSLNDVPPGVRPKDDPFVIGYLARICPEKGLHKLCEAFSLLRRRGLDGHLRIAGYLPKANRAYLRSVMNRMKSEGWGGAVEYVGELDFARKIEFLQSLHVLSVPTVYRESKGLFVLEALACGVPVVQPRHGSFPELVEATGGGTLYEPASTSAHADAITELMMDPKRRVALGDAGRRAVQTVFNGDNMAERTWEVYERFGTPNA